MMSRAFFVCSLLLLLLVLTADCVNALAPWASPVATMTRSPPAASWASSLKHPSKTSLLLLGSASDSDYHAVYNPLENNNNSELSSTSRNSPAWLVGAMVAMTPEVAHAAQDGVIGSALAAYGHYLSILIVTACIAVERFTIKPNMSDEEEDRIAIADIVLGVAGVLLSYTGYLRVVQYGKGWDFYSHEPIFWLKIALVGIFGAASFFNTIKIIQRSVDKRNGTMVPMSEKLANRMHQVCNAELTALASIPLTATLMSRGVLYSSDVSWQVGAAFSFLVFGGFSFKYVKEALEWSEEEQEIDIKALSED